MLFLFIPIKQDWSLLVTSTKETIYIQGYIVRTDRKHRRDRELAASAYSMHVSMGTSDPASQPAPPAPGIPDCDHRCPGDPPSTHNDWRDPGPHANPPLIHPLTHQFLVRSNCTPRANLS